ncbi:hypothetical protein KUM39_04215 [Streptomyces sp. J2-1]|uniref:hypothetical protein n=1 Tax=Streptomyces corallincola TaxID=2851888 RepID=UPI001C388F97|nr:hypothetical protein [Streptomyces corallincola]MBV2353569.1 hypothetical protein [Streptomyces corallincola]
MPHWVQVLLVVLLFAFVAGMFALVITVFARGRREDARIREDHSRLPLLARERGWTYQARVRGRIDQYCGAGPMPGRGSNLSAWHHTTGEFRGHPFTYFEYRYNSPMTGADGAERKPIIKTVFVVTAPGTAPSVEILRPSKLNALLDRRPSTTLGVPEFDQRFRVVTKDEDFVRTALSGAVVPYLLKYPEARKSPLQFRENELFTWYTGTLSPQAVEERLAFLCDVLQLVPERSWASA